MLAEAVKARGQNCRYCDTFEEISAYLNKTASAGDMILVMGAGDINKVTALLK